MIPISSKIGCEKTISEKVLSEIRMQRQSKNKKHYEKDQQTNIPFDNVYRKNFTR